ncbi:MULTISPECIES: COG4705 family protein [Pseudomonadaceae]|jgi:uncharacterized membrane-anchored protein|uniref:Membrane protein n=2 Tax=Pseudomonadaceae TaxID=135621 RepID=A0A6J4DWX5_9PSED|nr:MULTISPECIES: hypothetical protein [Pseudomonas]EQM69814.1 hypothetical protein L682_12130 [Pseudomonas alcaligenes OT 69]MDH0895517.1 hypothetical protein [Pseudomonas sp. GD03875]MDH1065613.1 hypothetical protein [Pseudomonas sp. GD03985]MDN4143576.1 hypothetical protein [Pseudomonas tohonis]SUD13094.1 membrane protein [Pseudomonas alcaligenes]
MRVDNSDWADALQNKVPVVALVFWVIKILSTTVGETGADFLIFKLHFGLPLTSLIMGALLVAVMFIQLRSEHYVPWKYWLAVVQVSIFGTLVTDSLVDTYGVALTTTTAVFSVLLVLTFVLWFAQEKTLSILAIYPGRREFFYWTAILMTFALGTAAGDLVAEELKLGYAISALFFAGCILAVAIAHYFFRLDVVTAFWVAYVLTRPFGASVGDWLSHSAKKGGLGLGTVGTSEVFAVIIIALVCYLSWRDRPRVQAGR